MIAMCPTLAVRQQSCCTRAEGSPELINPLTPSKQAAACISCSDVHEPSLQVHFYRGAVLQQSSEAAKPTEQDQPSNLALVTSFHHHENPMHVYHYQAGMALCRKRNSIELAMQQPGSEATKRSTAEQPFLQSVKADVHHTHARMALCRKRNSIELAVRQQGSEAAKRSTEQAAKEGSAVGLLRVLLKEHDHDNVQMVQLAAKPLLLQDLKVYTTVTKPRLMKPLLSRSLKMCVQEP